MQRILYVEDDLSLIDGLQYTLESSGYAVDNARTVKEALSLFQSSHYDLLLLDVTLPDGTSTAPASMFAKMYETVQPFLLYF